MQEFTLVVDTAQDLGNHTAYTVMAADVAGAMSAVCLKTGWLDDGDTEESFWEEHVCLYAFAGKPLPVPAHSGQAWVDD